MSEQPAKPNYRSIAIMGAAIGLGMAIGRGVGSQVDNFWLGLLVSAVVGAAVAGAVLLATTGVVRLLDKGKNKQE